MTNLFQYWNNEPESFGLDDDLIMIESKGNTDLFIDPISQKKYSNAPFFNFEIDSDFTFSCKIKPKLTNTYDAGAIVLYQHDSKWLKFAFEKTDLGYTSIVSVVTDDFSDDSNGERIFDRSVSLKISRKGDNVGLYYSLDDQTWKMVRVLNFGFQKNAKTFLGIASQSPLGKGCVVQFTNITFETNSITDFRKGI